MPERSGSQQSELKQSVSSLKVVGLLVWKVEVVVMHYCFPAALDLVASYLARIV
jgi:hypothetical protein